MAGNATRVLIVDDEESQRTALAGMIAGGATRWRPRRMAKKRSRN